ncbi:fimbrillin family protein [uncultured Bacteroides sp.]|uniref:fimbrillin family protein n=1 Tax=uncultured Bacteroides sp. TaxID=162156 RepID=UPI00259779AC|nr:fimbrillin family protein [uncultured Bacteroides sp.]
MKTNIFKSSFLALAMMASFSACTQNEEFGTPAPADEDILNVVAYSNNFVSTDAASRITDNGTTTTFTDGDAIGVFIVREGEALVSNMKMTLSGTAWEGDNDAPLYYYKNADYIAYYPYTANLAVTTVDEIVEYFTSKISTTGQTSLADYRNADLMTAEVKAADVVRGQNITFNFAHKMAMLEVKAPVRSYTTTDGSFTYKAPLGLKVMNGTQVLSLCNVGTDATSGKDIFRCILVPSATEMTIEGQFQDGNVEVYFPAVGQEVKYTPAAGTYQGVNIDYDYANYDPSRDLKVGDYYYSDGSIYPGDLTGAPKDGCVGIIFSTTVGETALTEKGYNHGYVVALENARHETDSPNTSNNLGYYYKWNKTAANIWTIVSTPAEVIAQEDGYTKTYDEANAINCYAAQIALNFGKHEDQAKYLNPANTSGWFLPSSGLLDDILHNLSGTTGLWDETNGFSDTNEKDKKLAAFKTIQPKFTTLGGTFIGSGEIEDVTPNTDRWWSITDAPVNGTEYTAWAVEIKLNGQSKLLERNVASENASVRPVFAF